jgi:transposase
VILNWASERPMVFPAPLKRAAVAVARKLAVLLHRLWVSGEVYEPLHNAMSAPLAAAA